MTSVSLRISAAVISLPIKGDRPAIMYLKPFPVKRRSIRLSIVRCQGVFPYRSLLRSFDNNDRDQFDHGYNHNSGGTRGYPIRYHPVSVEMLERTHRIVEVLKQRVRRRL